MPLPQPALDKKKFTGFLKKTHAPLAHLDMAIKKTAENFKEISYELEKIKNELNFFIGKETFIKLMLKFSQDSLELVDSFFEAIIQPHFNSLMNVITKFYYIWVESNCMHNSFPKVQAFVYSILASLILYAFSLQVAWLTHSSHSMGFGFSLISIAVGIQIISPVYVFTHGFFKFAKHNHRNYQQRQRLYR